MIHGKFFFFFPLPLVGAEEATCPPHMTCISASVKKKKKKKTPWLGCKSILYVYRVETKKKKREKKMCIYSRGVKKIS